MEQMAQRDLEAFLSFLRGIYGHLDLERFASHVVSALPEVIPSELTSYSEGLLCWPTAPLRRYWSP